MGGSREKISGTLDRISLQLDGARSYDSEDDA